VVDRLDDVVVTGMSVIAPGSIGLEDFWRNAILGKIATGPLERFDTSGLQTAMGGEVRQFDPIAYFHRLDSRKVSLATQFAVAAARLCIRDAEAPAPKDQYRAGVCIGSVSSCRPNIEDFCSQEGFSEEAHGTFLAAPCQPSRSIADEIGFYGPNLTITTACAAGNSAICWAADAIRAGRADIMVAGGADQISYAMLGFFSRLRAFSTDVVRPFDRDRTGLLISDGAAALLLERREHAAQRGARIYCKVAGYGNFADAYHMTAPHPEGRGAVRSMQEALRTAEVRPSDLGFVSAHGTGTPGNDVIESRALESVFGKDSVPPVSSLKSQLGHAQGAASAIEAVACVLTLHTGTIHPTINLTTLDPECSIDVVTKPRELQKRAVLNNAFGFGGNNACVIFAA
jgi:3-oxoacyl-(acyl-carrier-protein) synthase